MQYEHLIIHSECYICLLGKGCMYSGFFSLIQAIYIKSKCTCQKGKYEFDTC